MRGQTAIGHEITFNFVRVKTNGSAQLKVGQPFLSQVENRLETDMEILGNSFGRP
jgi:hypothetical protein